MKRSDVVRLIYDMLQGESFASCEYSDTELYSTLILTKLEEIGMLPPRTKLKGLDLEDNSWEPEE